METENFSKKQISVLINAYAVSPNWGSEPGMGWNWVINLAKYCNVFIITEGEWKNEIEEAVGKLPQKANLHFFYNPVSEKIRKMCWDQGDWRFYWYYRKWQKRTFEIAKKICCGYKIDVIHQLNMIGFREPGYLWKIKDIPFVWGPVGGMELTPAAYFKDTPLKMRLFLQLKNKVNDWQRKHSSRVCKAIHRASCVIAATSKVAEFIRDYHGKEVITINETGCYPIDIETEKRNDRDKETFDLLWVGRIGLYTKQLGLALKSIAKTKNLQKLKFHIVGNGLETEMDHYKLMAKELGIDSICQWYGLIPNNEVLTLMRHMDLMLFTSIMEATSTVVLEAMQTGLPVISFDTCGFGPIVKEFGGVTILLTNPEQSIRDFADVLNNLECDRDKLVAMRREIANNRNTLTWEYKTKYVSNLYFKAINQ